MRSSLFKRLSSRSIPLASNSSIPCRSSCSRHYTVSATEAAEEAGSVTLPREGPEFSFALNWALAGRGVIVKDKVLHNLDSSELQKNGATRLESLSGIPLHVRGNAVEGASKISRAQFAELLKQVTSHISSVSNVFVQDGAVASAGKCDAKVRVISDSPSAILSLSHILWETPSRAVSHDSCPLTVYVASNISPRISQAFGLATQASTGFAAADIERSSLILCGRAFADANAIRDALAALAAPLISARGGLPLAARLLEAGDSMILLFASEDTIRTCSDLCQALVTQDVGVVLSSDSVVPFFRTRGPAKKLLKKPASVIIASADSTGAIPLVSKLSPGQAAYHFLAGYQDGKFLPAFSRGPSPLDPLALAIALFSHLKNNEISSFLINVNSGGKHITGEEIIRLASVTLSDKTPEGKTGIVDSKVRDLKGKYRSFLSSKFQELPEEFTF
ncbi:uncharacterized protein LOC109837282 isoform X1 [Asparagus officinalis]|uniref:uncharacterized protein LOC109837282 isoform X1 n=1 Tax=Asparagus officinalis TaxID=4686 RepID=UPI00098E6185|nr:uncharacterized protein LOC109837282 isoform X1 [Asparagus officinalis]